MPLIIVSMYPGRTKEQKEEFAKAVTKSAVEILKTKENHVIVVFDENPKENWYMAGNPL
ncbi:MAG: 4-oxalocrotonate tautomerase family protein [Thaumarchaeota archaeon]|nr:MAG: 4-oxalocrotonate tautomerase [Thaumarchaeota archaeon 13_1_40CM_2_39_13_1]OLE43437.1 MAG: 4-oxalocrotonate tautomerase [Thaumarchaeota archaeon 13_1_20CM_2_39_11]TLX93219.1 MAG: 4-oxalocrotonate tautomerase family protein [Nitrososphaerota archaeon]